MDQPFIYIKILKSSSKQKTHKYAKYSNEIERSLANDYFSAKNVREYNSVNDYYYFLQFDFFVSNSHITSVNDDDEHLKKPAWYIIFFRCNTYGEKMTAM